MEDFPEYFEEQEVKRRPWRDPVAFLPLEALIESGLGEVPQVQINKSQVRSAIRIYVLRHPEHMNFFFPPKEHTPKYSKLSAEKLLASQVNGRIGGLTRLANTTPEQRKAIAMKAITARWRNHSLTQALA